MEVWNDRRELERFIRVSFVPSVEVVSMFCVRIRAALRAATAALLLIAPARAEAQEEPLQLSLGDALVRAERRAPDVVLAKHAERAAVARRVGAGILLPENPRLAMDARPLLSGFTTPGNQRELGFAATLEAPFELGGAPGARVREAERYADVARAELVVEQLRSKAAAWTAYVRTRVSEQRIVAAKAAAENARRILDASKQRSDAGATGDIEQSLAASDLAQIEALISEATRERALHLMELRDSLDLPAEQPVELTTAVGNPDLAPPAEALVARALQNRPESLVVKKRIELFDATEERLRKEIFPRIGIYGGIDATPASPVFGIIGLSFTLPVAQRNQGPRAVNAAQRDGESERGELVARRIAREVAVAYAAYDARRVELETLTTKALPTAQRTYELVEMGWRSGRFDIFRVATSARDVARVRSLVLDALEATWLERIALERATGAIATAGVAK